MIFAMFFIFATVRLPPCHATPNAHSGWHTRQRPPAMAQRHEALFSEREGEVSSENDDHAAFRAIMLKRCYAPEHTFTRYLQRDRFAAQRTTMSEAIRCSPLMLK